MQKEKKQTTSSPNGKLDEVYVLVLVCWCWCVECWCLASTARRQNGDRMGVDVLALSVSPFLHSHHAMVPPFLCLWDLSTQLVA
jgi:hypothetical protein